MKKISLFYIFLLISITCKLHAVNTVDYYKNWWGHEIHHLNDVYQSLKKSGCTNFIFYAGESSLDNKYWVFEGKSVKDFSSYEDEKITAPAVNGYENILVPPRMVKDVDYWMNKLLVDGRGPKNKKICSIMTAIEASTLNGRLTKWLLPQDEFIRDNLTPNDYLIVAVGANDIAMPVDKKAQESFAALQNDPHNAEALQYLVSIFGSKTKDYIEKLIVKNKPKHIFISMIYYPDENEGKSWAKSTLDALEYSKNPTKLQALINYLFKEGTQKIQIPGAKITPIALSKALDGKNASDYVERIEPSAQGGRKMAELFIEALNISEQE